MYFRACLFLCNLSRREFLDVNNQKGTELYQPPGLPKWELAEAPSEPAEDWNFRQRVRSKTKMA